MPSHPAHSPPGGRPLARIQRIHEQECLSTAIPPCKSEGTEGLWKLLVYSQPMPASHLGTMHLVLKVTSTRQGWEWGFAGGNGKDVAIAKWLSASYQGENLPLMAPVGTGAVWVWVMGARKKKILGPAWRVFPS